MHPFFTSQSHGLMSELLRHAAGEILRRWWTSRCSTGSVASAGIECQRPSCSSIRSLHDIEIACLGWITVTVSTRTASSGDIWSCCRELHRSPPGRFTAEIEGRRQTLSDTRNPCNQVPDIVVIPMQKIGRRSAGKVTRSSSSSAPGARAIVARFAVAKSPTVGSGIVASHGRKFNGCCLQHRAAVANQGLHL